MSKIVDRILELAKLDIGIREIKENNGWKGEKGKILQGEMEDIGWTKGTPYCSLWCRKIFYNAYMELGREDLAKICLGFISPLAQATLKVFGAKTEYKGFRLSGDPVNGSIGIMAVPDSIHGHAVIVRDKFLGPGVIGTYEANTSITGSRDGDGIYENVRSLNYKPHGKSLYFKMFIVPAEV